MKKATILFLIVALVAVAFAQDTEQQKKTREALTKRRKMTTQFQEADLEIVVWQIAAMSEVSIVIDQKACKGLKTTLSLNNATPEETLKMMLEPHKLDYIIKKDGTIFVSTKEKIAQMRGEGKKKEETKVKEGELFLVLKDGSKIKGKVAVEKWKLKTAYGELTIPANEIRKIRLAQEEEKKEDEEKEKKEEKDKEEKDKPEEDEVETIRFTVTGELQVEKLEIETGKGKLTIPKSDIKEILFPRPVIEKSFEVKPDGKWHNTRIRVKKGSNLKITAQGRVNQVYTPDGKTPSPPGAAPSSTEGYPLVAKIGEDGEEFKVGYACETQVKKEGNLYLRIKVPVTVAAYKIPVKGSYKVKVSVQK